MGFQSLVLNYNPNTMHTCGDDIEEVPRPEGLPECAEHLHGVAHAHPLHSHLSARTETESDGFEHDFH